jgi:hypothetical protein
MDLPLIWSVPYRPICLLLPYHISCVSESEDSYHDSFSFPSVIKSNSQAALYGMFPPSLCSAHKTESTTV